MQSYNVRTENNYNDNIKISYKPLKGIFSDTSKKHKLTQLELRSENTKNNKHPYYKSINDR